MGAHTAFSDRALAHGLYADALNSIRFTEVLAGHILRQPWFYIVGALEWSALCMIIAIWWWPACLGCLPFSLYAAWMTGNSTWG